MASVTGMTADHIEQLVNQLISTASIDENGVLNFQTLGGATIPAGTVDTSDLAVKRAYPVGALYFGTSPENPADLFDLPDTTWVAWGTGRTPVAVDPAQTEFAAAEQTGGEKTHTLQIAEMPQHAHTTPAHSHTINHDHANSTASSDTHNHTIGFRYAENHTTGGNAVAVFQIDAQVPGVSGGTGADGTTSNDTHSHTVNIPSYSGSSGTFGTSITGLNPQNAAVGHNNLQPYITCYIWKRTS